MVIKKYNMILAIHGEICEIGGTGKSLSMKKISDGNA